MPKMHCFIFALFIGLGSAISIDDCPSKLHRDKYLQVFQNYCFRFHPLSRVDYRHAQAHCQRQGGNLAMPKTKQINDYLTNELHTRYKSTQDTWIGLNDIKEENTFVWPDSTPMTWQNFGKNEGPRTGYIRHQLEDCVTLRPNTGTWHDYHCADELLSFFTVHKPYICQYTVSSSSSRTTPEPTDCPTILCNIDCGMSDYKIDQVTKCMLCECDN